MLLQVKLSSGSKGLVTTAKVSVFFTHSIPTNSKPLPNPRQHCVGTDIAYNAKTGSELEYTPAAINHQKENFLRA